MTQMAMTATVILAHVSLACAGRTLATQTAQRTPYVVESVATILMLSTPTREVGLLSSPLAL
jgi:hypothetical protein